MPDQALELDDFGTDARRAIALAEAEARALGHEHLGTEHLLLGILRDDAGPASEILREAGASFAAARHKVAEAVGADATRAAATSGALSPTPRAARAVARTLRLSHHRRSEEVLSHELLLGVLDVEGTACQVLRSLGVDIDHLREMLGGVAAFRATRESDPSQRRRTDTSAAATAVAPVCGGCGAGLEDTLVWTAVRAGSLIASQAGRDAIAFSCARCGRVLGVAPE